jgi:acetyl-CoA synthetase
MPRQLFANDLVVGQRFAGASHCVDDKAFENFAALTGDSHPIHYDDAYAARSRFGKRVAHGLLLNSLTALGATPLSGALEDSMIAFLEQSCRFKKPVFVGEHLTSEFLVASVKFNRDGATAIVRFDVKLTRRDGEAVLEGHHTYLLHRSAPETGIATPGHAKPSHAAASQAFDWTKVFDALGYRPGNSARKIVGLGRTICDRHAAGPGAVRTALLLPDKDGSERRVTYGELARFSNGFAHVLRQLGVKKGDRVATYLPRGLEALVAILGILNLGAVYVPIFTAYNEVGIRYRVRHSGASLLVTDASVRDHVPADLDIPVICAGGSEAPRDGDRDFWDELNRQPATFEAVECCATDAAAIIYTSGSTGAPKGGVLAVNFLAAVWPYIEHGLDLDPEADLFWPTGDPAWGYGFVCYLGVLAAGGTAIVLRDNLSGADCLSVLARHRVSNLATTPSLLRSIMALGDDAVRRAGLALRVITSCGEPLNAEVVEFFVRTCGTPPLDNFGATEYGLPIGNCASLGMPVKPGSMGLVSPGYQAAIVDDDGKELPTESVGLVAVKASDETLYWKEYWGDPAASAALRRGAWLCTGDLARRDSDGYFWFEGRADDMIKSSGYRIGPFEIESALLKHSAVAEAAVVGKPDALRGQIIKAFLVLRGESGGSDALAAEILESAKRHLGKHQYPREIEFVPELPKTPSGKIQRFALRGGK